MLLQIVLAKFEIGFEKGFSTLFFFLVLDKHSRPFTYNPSYLTVQYNPPLKKVKTIICSSSVSSIFNVSIEDEKETKRNNCGNQLGVNGDSNITFITFKVIRLDFTPWK